ncbi:hypothetical protein BN13_20031 [Nostocoides jenkinsii Ben 74]|uniref:Uncharacterized protein n=1 Tax=Nostocoides jenkinsii Ben 74 TaxID=1193518 RepID=A0A077M7Z1_9MICO|nr:hypothetical protein BN13_20031 [Tetrasphaera jenkinsii Ben 74]
MILVFALPHMREVAGILILFGLLEADVGVDAAPVLSDVTSPLPFLIPELIRSMSSDVPTRSASGNTTNLSIRRFFFRRGVAGASGTGGGDGVGAASGLDSASVGVRTGLIVGGLAVFGGRDVGSWLPTVPSCLAPLSSDDAPVGMDAPSLT